jgi:hypothetical protein
MVAGAENYQVVLRCRAAFEPRDDVVGIDPLALMAAWEAATAVSGEEGAPHGAGHHALLPACVSLDEGGVTAEPLGAFLCNMADTSVVGQFGDMPFRGCGFLSDDDGETVPVGR